MKKNLLTVPLLMLVFTALFILNPATTFAADKKDLLKIATPILDELTKGLETKNYDLYMKSWVPEAKKMLSKEKFKESCDATLSQTGKLKSKTYYKTLQDKGYTIVQWKGVFSKAPGELYIWVILKKVDGKYYVAGHWIKPMPYPGS